MKRLTPTERDVQKTCMPRFATAAATAAAHNDNDDGDAKITLSDRSSQRMIDATTSSCDSTLTNIT